MQTVLLALAVAGAAVRPAGPATPSGTPQLLVLGAPHFGNPGLDVGNASVPDVLGPDRQAEIAAVVERLAAFRPTMIAVEAASRSQSKVDRRYSDYRSGRSKLGPGEDEQIAFRLAHRLGLPRVHAVDWNEMPPGGEADWDYEVYAANNGRSADLRAVQARSRATAAGLSERARCMNVAGWLHEVNRPQAREESHRIYFDYALLGDAQRNPGATWVGNWYARNLKIFANLGRLARSSSDRVLVVYGAGHGYLLDQFARQSGAFAVPDTLAYLPPPARNAGADCR